LERDASAQETGGTGVAGSNTGRKPGGRTDPEASPRVCVTLHVRSRKLMDEHDNLKASLKPLVDAIAASLGLEDKDGRIVWQYGQTTTRGKPGVTVTVEELQKSV